MIFPSLLGIFQIYFLPVLIDACICLCTSLLNKLIQSMRQISVQILCLLHQSPIINVSEIWGYKKSSYYGIMLMKAYDYITSNFVTKF